MSCKDCTEKENSYKYFWLERPDEYTLGYDINPSVTYYFPVGDLYDVENHPPLKQYYTNKEFELFQSDFLEAVGFPITTPNYEAYQSFWGQYPSDVITMINTFGNNKFTTYGKKWVKASLYNPNLGKPYSEDPSFVFWEGHQILDVNPIYEDLEIPTTFLQYNRCGIEKEKITDNIPLLIKGCGVNTIEFRLRLRSLAIFSAYNRDGRHIYGIRDKNSSSYTLEGARKQYETFKGLESHSGAKAFGLAKLRYEVGIYNHNKDTYKPIVFSSPNYPQPFLMTQQLGSPAIWKKEKPDVFTNDGDIENLQNPIFGVNPSSPEIKEPIYLTSTMSSYINGSGYDIGYYYGGVGTPSDVGRYNVIFNNLATGSATKITFSKNIDINLADVGAYELNVKSVSKKIGTFFKKLKISGTKPASLELSIEYKRISCSGNNEQEWKKLSEIQYNVTSVDNANTNDDYVTLNITQISNVFLEAKDCSGVAISDINTQTSLTNFYTLNDYYEYRYKIDVNGYLLVGGVVESFIVEDSVGGNPELPTQYDYTLIPNYNQLTEEFVSELTGFVEVNLDEGDVSLYLRILPDNDGYDSIKFQDLTNSNIWNDYILNENPLNKKTYNGIVNYIGLESTSASCNSNIFTSYELCNPWGELGVDERTFYKKPTTVYYEPVLPLRPDFLDTTNVPLSYWLTTPNQRHARQNRFGTTKNNFFSMIEESWVRIKKLGEDCCD